MTPSEPSQANRAKSKRRNEHGGTARLTSTAKHPPMLLVPVATSLLLLACGSNQAPHEAPRQPDPQNQKHEQAGSAHAHDEHHGHRGHAGPIGHRFEKANEWTSVFDDPQRDAWQKPEEVVALLRLSPGNSVADIGAGTGYFLPHLSRAVGREGIVFGVDIEQDMVRHMRERAEKEGLANVQALQAKPDAPMLAPASVDRILIVNTWHHIPNRADYTRKLSEALRPAGAVYIVDYTLDSPHGPPKEHRLPPQRVVEELEMGGLKASVIEESLPQQYVVVGHKL